MRFVGNVLLFLVVRYLTDAEQKKRSLYHVMSGGSRSCTVGIDIGYTVALVCSVDMTSPEIDEAVTRACADQVVSVRWQRMSAIGRYVNMTASSSKYSVWKNDVKYSSSGGVFHVLQIADVQRDDLATYRCVIECGRIVNGEHVSLHREASVCEQHSANSAFQICEMVVDLSDELREHSQPCLSVFGDGRCDAECDTEETQFDGFDCINSPTAPAAAAADDDDDWECDDVTRRGKSTSRRRPKCSAVYADGNCDEDCDSSACLWDGGDCIGTALRLSEDALVVTFDETSVNKAPLSAQDGDVRQLIRSVSRLLHTVIRIINRDLMRSDSAAGTSRDSDTSSMLLVKIDNTRCVSRCFSTARSAGNFLAVHRARQLGTLNLTSVAVLERVVSRGQCALLNETVFSPERGAASANRRPTSIGLGDLTNTRLFWIVVMSALSGTCLVLLTVAVAVLMRRVCCYVDTTHRRHRYLRQQQQQQRRASYQLSSWRHRISTDCGCRQTSPMSQLPLADIDQSDDLSPGARCDDCHATQV